MLYLSSYKSRYTTSHPVIFADDIHLIIEITKNINNESIICDEINNMKIWSESNDLPLNDDKMKLIYFGKNGHKSNIFSEPLILNNLVDNLKIFGVQWNEKLSWRDHFDCVIAKCNSRLHAINVTKRVLNHDELWLLFYFTVVSLIEYAAP